MTSTELHKPLKRNSAIFRSICISVVIHLMVIAAAAAASNGFLKQETKPIVIRLYSEDVLADNRPDAAERTEAVTKPKRQTPPAMKKTEYAKKQEPVVQNPAPEIPLKNEIKEKAESVMEQTAMEVKEVSSQAVSSADSALHNNTEVHNSGETKALGDLTQGADRVGLANNAAYDDHESSNALYAKAETSKQKYLKEHFIYIKDRIYKNLVYPVRAKKMGWSGKVMISFIICEDGRVKDLKIVKSSGFEILDLNVVDTVKESQPFPKPPVRAELLLPVSYVIQ